MTNPPEYPTATICARDPDCSKRDLTWAQKLQTTACQKCILRWRSQNGLLPETPTPQPPPVNNEPPTTRSGKRIVDQGN